MGDQCYHISEEVPITISRGVQNHWPNSALWSIHIISTQNRGSKPPCSILFVIFQRVGLHIFIFDIHKLLKCKRRSFSTFIKKKNFFFCNSKIQSLIYISMNISLIKLDLSIFCSQKACVLTKTAEYHVSYIKNIHENINLGINLTNEKKKHRFFPNLIFLSILLFINVKL